VSDTAEAPIPAYKFPPIHQTHDSNAQEFYLRYLGKQHLVVPNFQRPVAWTRADASAVLRSWYDSFKRVQSFGFSNVLVHKGDGGKHIGITDGQQRHTLLGVTLALAEGSLPEELRKKVDGVLRISGKPRMVHQYRDEKDTYAAVLTATGGSDPALGGNFVSQIHAAARTFLDRTFPAPAHRDEIGEGHHLSQFVEYLLTSVPFSFIEVGDETEASVMFHQTNGGKGISRTTSVKGKLLEAADGDKKLTDEITSTWQTLQDARHNADGKKKKFLNEDNMLVYIFTNIRGSEVVNSEESFSAVVDSEVVKGGLKAFLAKLARTTEAFNLLNEKKNPHSKNPSPALAKVEHKGGINQTFFPLIAVALRSKDEAQFEEWAGEIVGTFYRWSIILDPKTGGRAYPAPLLRKRLLSIMRDIYGGQFNPSRRDTFDYINVSKLPKAA
jgi:hypothetical protein